MVTKYYKEIMQTEKWVVRDLHPIIESWLINEIDTIIVITKNVKYTITAKNNYLGCIATNRFPNEGESWLRGNDLYDGKFNEDTWFNIVKDIKNYENI